MGLNLKVYRARKVCRQLCKEGIKVARCTVERLMKYVGLKGSFCTRKLRTTIADESLARSADLVCRNFTALRPNQLWVVGLAYVAIYRGFACVAFIIDVFARFIIG